MEVTSRTWGALALRGLIAILFGLAVLFWPGISLAVFILLFAAFALLDGIFALAAGFSKDGWPLLLEGLISILAAVVAILWPGIAIIAFVWLLAFWALATGIIEIIAAINLRKVIKGEWLLVLGGILSIILGILLFVYPIAGIVALIWVMGIYAIIFGIVLLFLSFRLKAHVK